MRLRGEEPNPKKCKKLAVEQANPVVRQKTAQKCDGNAEEKTNEKLDQRFGECDRLAYRRRKSYHCHAVKPSGNFEAEILLHEHMENAENMKKSN